MLESMAGRSWFARDAFLRSLGFIYFIAFLIMLEQGKPLIGSHGLLPLAHELNDVAEELGSRGAGFRALPSLFWLSDSDAMLTFITVAGLLLSVLLMAGVTNALVPALLWVLDLSVVQVGQIFWGYGWETMLLEAGFAAIFLCPLRNIVPFPEQSPTPKVMPWVLRWLLFRLMLGAGLVKIRGDSCWRDLTCLVYHYETQPNPNPLAWLLNQSPLWLDKVGVLWNHFIELVVPWFLFGPRRVRNLAVLLEVLFQINLILSGNLSFLNWLTIVIAIGCLDDVVIERIYPRKLRERVATYADAPKFRWWQLPAWSYAALVALLSFNVVQNLLSTRQHMNTSFDRLHLVNTYGAFGSIGRVRDEVVLEGTDDDPADENAHWREYGFNCKPGEVSRRPCVITPYHYRLDWQMWFAAMSQIEEEPWLVHFAYKLLQNDPGALSLIHDNPFANKPPRYIRAELYEYHFTRFDDHTRDWWKRERAGVYMRPVSLDDPGLREALVQFGLE
jgi:hypothetical protein